MPATRAAQWPIARRDGSSRSRPFGADADRARRRGPQPPKGLISGRIGSRCHLSTDGQRRVDGTSGTSSGRTADVSRSSGRSARVPPSTSSIDGEPELLGSTRTGAPRTDLSAPKSAQIVGSARLLVAPQQLLPAGRVPPGGRRSYGGERDFERSSSASAHRIHATFGSSRLDALYDPRRGPRRVKSRATPDRHHDPCHARGHVQAAPRPLIGAGRSGRTEPAPPLRPAETRSAHTPFLRAAS
jgi:hypothetical protein